LHCKELSPNLEISVDIIGLDNLPDCKNLTWSSTFQRGFTYTAPHSDNGQTGMILPNWNICLKIWFICNGHNRGDFEFFVNRAGTRSRVNSIKRIIDNSDIFLMLPGSFIKVKGGHPHAVLTIFPKGCSKDEPLLAFGYIGVRISEKIKSYVKGMNYKK
jgi:hypothetical protein